MTLRANSSRGGEVLVWLGAMSVLIGDPLVLLQQYQNATDQDTHRPEMISCTAGQRFRAVRPINQTDVPVVFPVATDDELNRTSAQASWSGRARWWMTVSAVTARVRTT